MGRPQKKGLDRFTLPVDFFTRDVVCALRGEFGLKGEIALVKILCHTFRHGYYLKWNAAVRMLLLGELPGVNVELLQQIVQRLVRWEYFDSRLFRQHKVLTSVAVQTEYFSLTRRRQLPGRMPYMLVVAPTQGVSVCNNSVNVYNNSVNVDRNGVSVCNNGVSVCNNPVNVDKNGILSPSPPTTPSTLKEKKINPKGFIQKKKRTEGDAAHGKEKSCAKKEKAPAPPTLQQVQQWCQGKGIGDIEAKRFWNYYTAVGWLTGNGIPITQWQAKLEEWMIKQQMDENGKKRTSERSAVRNADAAADNGIQGTGRVSKWTGSDI